MKKFLGAIISGVVGILTLVFLSLPAFIMDMDVLGEQKASGWDLLTKKEWAEMDMTAVTWYRIFAWILVALAVILIVLAVLQLLSSLGIIKMPGLLTTINHWALGAIAVAAILALIANFGIRGEIIDSAKDAGIKGDALKSFKDMYSIGASLWVVSILALVGGVVGKIFVKKED